MKNSFSIKIISVLVLILLGWGTSFGQLKANFQATPISGCAPLLVNFKDLSTGNPTSWIWDLGNGTISYNRNSSTTYLNAGTYTVKLVVKNSSGADSVVKEQLIQVYPPPTVKFSGTPTSGCLPLETKFTDESTTSAGTIAKWQWDFGDGFNSEEQNPTHTYTDQGNYNVSLRIVSSEGCKASVTIPSFIKIDTQIVPKFQASKVDFCKAPATISFTNSTVGNGNNTYVWDFGDGNTSTEKSPTHTYTQQGIFTVKLSVTNNSGCTIATTKKDYIHIGAVQANFEIPDINCKQKTVFFKNTSAPTPSKVLWNFGDGTTSTAISPTKTYTSSGTFSVQLITYSGDCRDTIVKEIMILDNAVAGFTADKLGACVTPFEVNFSNTSTNASTYLWDFGDGNMSNEENPSHTYTTAGKFTVKLIVKNANGCMDTLIRKEYINIGEPTIFFNFPKMGCAPFTHTFVAAITPANIVKDYLWAFGDGNTSTEVSPTHIYNNPGRYTIKLTITTTDGCTITKQISNGILVGEPPQVSFTANNREVCANDKVLFSDASSGTVNEWLWEFGDGTTSSQSNPEHYYGDTGYYSVKLTAINDGCTSELLIPNFIHVKGPIANFATALDCNNIGQVTFTDWSKIPQTWAWDFGDGNTSTEKNPVHTYLSTGKYTVTLKVENATTGCFNTTIKTIGIIKEKADFTVSKSQSCKNIPITFTAINSNPGNISLYTWNFGNGIIRTTTSSSYTYTYPKSGIFNVSLKITDINGCTDTITKPLAVTINGPTAVFRSASQILCLGNSVNFIDSSYSDNTFKIVQWEWTWGDNLKDTLSGGPFQHTYNKFGNYTVSLKVTDENGCTDTQTKVAEVVVPQVVAGFSTDSLSCTAKSVPFKNTSIGQGLKYLWNFGDNSQSTSKDPIHLYNSEGIYTVGLSVEDENGCKAEIIKDSIVKVSNPIADFSADITYSYCPPLITQFTNQSLNYLKSHWDFGDMTSSSAPNPSHFYSSVGNFTAKLTVFGAVGCESTKTIDIVVKGPKGLFSYDTLQGCQPLVANFKATTFENKSFIWDFNDGTTVSTADSVISYTYTLPGKYVPKIILVDENDCHVPIQGNDTILVLGATANFTSDINLVCTVGKVSFSDSSFSNDQITKYFWNFGDGGTSTDKNPTHIYQTEGKYSPTLRVETLEGCKDTLMNKLRIDVNRKPIINIVGPDGACVPARLLFKGIHQNPDTSQIFWSWNFGNGKNASLPVPDSQLFSSPKIYSIEAIVNSSNGCADTATKMVEIYPLPSLKTTAAQNIICRENTTSITVTGAATYTWATNPTLSCTNCANPIAKPDTSQYYYVIGKSTHGCVSADSILISVKQPFNVIGKQSADTLCVGSSVKLEATGAEFYNWSPTSGLGTTSGPSVIATPQATVTYQVIGYDSENCFFDTAYFPIKVFPIPVVDAGPDTTINVGKQITIMPTISPDVSDVKWSPTTGIVSSNYPGITIRPTQTIQYRVDVENKGGCKSSDQKVVYVICNNANIFIPNTFSPNNDGVNDVFFPRGTGIFKIKDFKIFNRWGQMVFHRTDFQANDASVGWDGTFNGKPVMPDVFMYVMEVVCENNIILYYKGDITLIK